MVKLNFLKLTKSNLSVFSFFIVSVLLFGGCATTGSSLTREEVILGEKQLNRSAADYFFDSMTKITSVGNKILQHLPEEHAQAAYASLPLLFIDLNFDLQRIYGTNLSKGVMVAGLLENFEGSELIKRGDEVLSINGKQIKSEKDISQFLKKLKKESAVKIGFRRGGRQWDLMLPIHYLRKNYSFVLNGQNQGMVAYSDVNGFIYLTPAVLDFVQNEDELAFIMARQITIIAGRRFEGDIFSIKNMTRFHQKFEYYFDGKSQHGMVLFDPLGKSHLDQLTESQETKIDQTALNYLSLSGFEPQKGIQFFERLAVEKPNVGILSYNIKSPSPERLILMRKFSTGKTEVLDRKKVSDQEKNDTVENLRREHVNAFLDKTLQVTSVGYRILESLPSEETSHRIVVLPLLYLDIKSGYRKDYNLASDRGVFVAGVLENLYPPNIEKPQRGDEILSLNGKNVLSESNLNEMLQSVQEDKVLIHFRRDTNVWEQELPVFRLARKVSFAVQKDDENINAFADMFGGITVTTSMLRFVEDDDQLALILAHEIAHLTNHHVGKKLTSTLVGTAS